MKWLRAAAMAGTQFVLLGFGLIAACSTACAQSGSASALEERAAIAASQAVIGKAVGDYLLYDRDGKPMRLSRFRGKPLLVSFVYTGCFQVCPLTTQFLSQAVRSAQNALGAESFHVATVGFNLPFDNPQAMQSFAKQQGVSLPQWDFLSPDPASRDGLMRDLGFSAVAAPKGFDHITQVTVIDGEGRVFQQIYGESFEIRMLVGPLKQLLTGVEAPTQNLDELLRKVRILCTIYDPLTGTYRLNYGVVIEILVGGSMLAATFAFLVWEWRRNRRARRA